ncbi:PLC-like phosphodiesterase [Crassisporium funariophilum]|nr:PLC-like phosphodiesterase [Crassisporium funariophilum]
MRTTRLLYRIFVLFSSLGLVICSTIAFPRATTCNGHAELCDRRDPFALARDQEVDIPTQLSLGIRLLQAQSHINPDDGVLHFCHTSCLVKTFLDANPNEVLTLLLTNPEGQSVSDVWKPASDGAGITPMAYVPPTVPVKQSDWPTLGELIDSGKRVVVFLDAGADPSSVDFILPEFQMIWETPFSVTDPSFPCSVDRINGPLATEDHTYMINHSLNKNIIPIGGGVIVSDPLDAPTTNGVASILANVNGCLSLGSNCNPQFLLLDFVNLGEKFEAADRLNGLSVVKPSHTFLQGGPQSTSMSSAITMRKCAEMIERNCILFNMAIVHLLALSGTI